MASRETVSALSSFAVITVTFTLMLGNNWPSRLSTSQVTVPTVRVPITETVVGMRVTAPCHCRPEIASQATVTCCPRASLPISGSYRCWGSGAGGLQTLQSLQIALRVLDLTACLHQLRFSREHFLMRAAAFHCGKICF